MLQWTIRSQTPKPVKTKGNVGNSVSNLSFEGGVMGNLGSPWRRFRDYMVLGLRDLVNLVEGLRYSPVPGEYPINRVKARV